MAGENFSAIFQRQRGQVFADHVHGRAVLLNEDGAARSAAQGFDADGAGARVDIQEDAIGKARSQDVEERLAHAVCRRTGIQTRQAL